MKLPQLNLEPVNRNRRNEGKQQAKTGGVTPSLFDVCSFLPEPLKTVCKLGTDR